MILFRLIKEDKIKLAPMPVKKMSKEEYKKLYPSKDET